MCDIKNILGSFVWRFAYVEVLKRVSICHWAFSQYNKASINILNHSHFSAGTSKEAEWFQLGYSIALCNKRSCSFTWKWCLIFMKMTALYNYRTTTWPLGDSIKSISQTEQKIKTLKLLFWKVWMQWCTMMVLQHEWHPLATHMAAGWLQVSWSDGKLSARFNELWTNLDAVELSPEWREFVVLGVCVVKKGSKTHLAAVLFKSVAPVLGLAPWIQDKAVL